ncbi:MAG: sensor histidine kinase, partial [Anaerolineales bacterium]|nr:sensor histidine kinase [Anaerolineales bacterium]
GFFSALTSGAFGYRLLSDTGVLTLPGVAVARWLDLWVWIPANLLPLTFLLLLFPDGHLPSRRWWPVGWAAGLGLAFIIIAVALHPSPPIEPTPTPNPFGMTSAVAVLDGLWVVAGVLVAVGMIGSLAALVVRFRRVRGIAREQLKGLVYATSLALLIAALLYGAATFWLNPLLAFEITLISSSAVIAVIATAVSLAILRYRLFEIDLVINRTLVYGLLTLIVAGLYVLVVGGLGVMFQAAGNWAFSLLGVGLVALVVQSVRQQLQSAVNRLMYGERDDPVSVLNRLGARLEATLAPEAVLPVLAETVGQTLKLPYVAIKVNESLAAEYSNAGTPPSAGLQAIPLKHQFETIGFLLVAPRAPGEPFSPLDQHLLENIARQAGMAVHAVSLTKDLQTARQSLVTAREEERRRLRRDLHDGLGPALASQGLKLAAAKQLLQHDPASAEPLLNEVMAQTQETVSDVRRLVYGLRPPALDERGLAEAIRDHVTQSVNGSLRVEVGELPAALPALPAAVEVAAYRIALEALTNVIRHAHAQQCSIQFQGNAHELRIEIADDGRGLPAELRAGVGLRSMRERAEELGGSLKVQAGLNGGTQVSAALPLGESTITR